MRFYTFKQRAAAVRASIRAESDWKRHTREAVLSEIRKSAAWQHAPTMEAHTSFSRLFHSLFAQAVLKPVVAGVLIFAVVSYSSVATVQAARASLPGDALYSVKLGIEAAQVGVAFSESKKAELEISFATTRLAEVSEILAKDETSEHIGEAIKRFSDDLGSVQKRLEKLQKEEKSEETVLKISKLVNEKTDELAENLLVIKEKIAEKESSGPGTQAPAAGEAGGADAGDGSAEGTAAQTTGDDLLATTTEAAVGGTNATSTIPEAGTATSTDEVAADTPDAQNKEQGAPESLFETLDGALEAVDQANIKSLEVFVEKASISADDVVKQDAVDKIQKKLEKIEKEVEAALSKEPQPLGQDAGEPVDTEPASSSSEERTATSTSEVLPHSDSTADEKPKQAKEGIDEVKKILESKQAEKFPKAVEKVKEIKAMVKEVDKKTEPSPEKSDQTTDGGGSSSAGNGEGTTAEGADTVSESAGGGEQTQETSTELGG